MSDVEASVVLHVRAEHSEGPVWDAESGCLWWVDITGCRVHRFEVASNRDCSWGMPGQPGGVLLTDDGQVVVGLPDGLAILNENTGRTDLVTPIESDRSQNRTNDMAADTAGRVWVGTMAYDRSPDAGALYCVADGTVRPAVTGLTISNGPAIDEAAGRIYFADTVRMIVYVCDFDGANGSLRDQRPFLDFSEVGTWPDGMTVDAEGFLWIALGRSGAVHRYSPDASLDAVVSLPVSNPTSVAFGGADLDELFITTSWYDLTPEQRIEQPLAGAIFGCRPGVRGVPAPRATVAQS